MYYFTASVPAYDKIILRESDTLEGLADATEHEIWHKHDTGIMGNHIWAPELHYLNQKWYIYFAAGDAGKGFAVVADQIRKLAEQSTQSAVDTRQLIESSLAEVEEGNKAAQRASDSIESVVDGIKSIAETSQELSQIAQEQAPAMEQAEQGINQISEVVQSNSATAEETSATSQELSAQATSLNDLISRFVLS